jgi:ubiquinone biosynthesis protein COQ4
MRRLNKNPGDRVAQRVFMLALDHAALERRLAFIAGTDGGRRLLRERPALDARHIPLDSLLTRAPGTFGRAIGEFLQRHGIAPFPPPQTAPADELEWMAQRVADTHDCLHTLTGYEGDPMGEVEIHAFMWAQWRPLTVLVVLLFGCLMSLRKHSVRMVWKRLRGALERGRQTERFEDLRWEDWLDRPLGDLRAHVGLR